MNIVTHYEHPPIPSGAFDWAATFDCYEPGDLIGRGPTEAAAVLSLEEQANEYQREQIETARSERHEQECSK